MDEFLTCTMGALYVSSACFMMLANVMRYAWLSHDGRMALDW